MGLGIFSVITPHPPPRRSPFSSKEKAEIGFSLGLRVSGGHLCEAEATTEPGGEKSCHEVTDEGDNKRINEIRKGQAWKPARTK